MQYCRPLRGLCVKLTARFVFGCLRHVGVKIASSSQREFIIALQGDEPLKQYQEQYFKKN